MSATNAAESSEPGSKGSTPAVIVVGAINVDLVVVAPHLPGPGETVVGAGMQIFGGGKGANAAVAAARVEARVALIGAVGSDDMGRRALGELAREGVDITGVAVLESTPTGVALIVVDANGENQIAVGSGANAALSASYVREQLRDRLVDAGCVLISAEIPPESIHAAVDEATRAGVCCIVNPAPMVACITEILVFGPILTPNETELADLLMMLGNPDGGAAAISRLSGAAVVITQGSAGVTIVAQGLTTQVPAHSVVAVDTTGAGDTFNGVFSAFLARGDRLIDAAGKAVVAASISVTEVGARGGMPTLVQLESEIANQ